MAAVNLISTAQLRHLSPGLSIEQHNYLEDILVLDFFRHYFSGLPILILVGDLVVILASVGLAYWRLEWIVVGPIWTKLVGLISTSLLFLYLADLYNIQVRFGRGELSLRLLLALGMAAVMFAAIGYAIPPLRYGRAAFLTITSLSTLGLLAFRFVTCNLGSYQRLQKRLLVLGTGLADLIIFHEGQNGSIPFGLSASSMMTLVHTSMSPWLRSARQGEGLAQRSGRPPPRYPVGRPYRHAGHLSGQGYPRM